MDYVGIGPVWETKSKDVSKKVVLGPSGVGKILDVLAEGTGKRVKSVAIGGVHLPNVPHLILGSTSPKHGNWLDGIAVISDIVSSSAPGKAAKELKEAVGRAKSYGMNDGDQKLAVTGIANQRTEEQWLNHVIDLMDVVREKRPLAHQVSPSHAFSSPALMKMDGRVQITNTVVANDSANATLALGGSPIMATHPKDVKDLSSAIDALLINFGWVWPLLSGLHWGQLIWSGQYGQNDLGQGRDDRCGTGSEQEPQTPHLRPRRSGRDRLSQRHRKR